MRFVIFGCIVGASSLEPDLTKFASNNATTKGRAGLMINAAHVGAETMSFLAVLFDLIALAPEIGS